jgi:hypothetical protein
MAKFSFDTSTVEVSGSGSAMPPIPDGTYHAMVMDSEIKTTAKGGTMIVLEWHIVGDGYDGRRIWQNYNVVCPGAEKAENIAKADMASACEAMGLDGYEDTDELHMQEIKVTVSTEPAKDGWPAKNKIDAYASAYDKPAQVAEPSEPSEPAQPSQPAGKQPPWAK